jgi:hypothetical protein
VVFVMLGAVALAADAASPPAGDAIVVTATNGGVVNFSIAIPLYQFGTVSAAGSANIGGTQSLTGTTSASGATYTATTATTWRATSSPPATIYIYNSSSSAVLTWGIADRLQIQLPTTNLSPGSVTCGFKNFTTTGDGGAAGCGSGNLIRNVLVKNGANAAVGNLDFQLFVDNTDATGTNTWVVVITEVGL